MHVIVLTSQKGGIGKPRWPAFIAVSAKSSANGRQGLSSDARK
jgi:septum formation inhibitor-activating ATPase MinD